MEVSAAVRHTYMSLCFKRLIQGYKIVGHPVARATKFCTLTPDICEPFLCILVYHPSAS